MVSYEVLGIRKGEYTDKKTKEKCGFITLFFGYEDPAINGIGCKDIFFPLARFPEISNVRLGDTLLNVELRQPLAFLTS